MRSEPYGKNILITGASSGLGQACAAAFAQAGYQVYGASRHCEEGSRQVGTGAIHTLRMDVTDAASVQHAVRQAIERAGELRMVLHCAGYGIGGAAEDTPIDEAKRQLDTNYFGVLRVNQALLGHMRACGGGLVLVVGSVAGLVSIPFQSHYASSKYALEAYVEALRMEGRPFGIRASLIEPGDTRTGFTGARRLCIPPYSPYREACEAAIDEMARSEKSGKPPETVAVAALRLSRRRNPPVRAVVGFDYQALTFCKRLLPARTIEWILRKMYCKGR